MAQDSSFGREQTIQCQKCLEFVSSSLTNCEYCGAVISLEAEKVSEDAQSKVASARNDSYFLKLMARTLAVSFIAMTFSIFSRMALASFLILLVAVPLMLVRWWVKYRGLKTEDRSYDAARLEAIIAAVVWCAVLLVWLFASVIQAFLMMQR